MRVLYLNLIGTQEERHWCDSPSSVLQKDVWRAQYFLLTP